MRHLLAAIHLLFVVVSAHASAPSLDNPPAAAPGAAQAAWRVADFWRSEHGLPGNTIQSLLHTRDGYLWVGTREGLARFDGVRFTTYGAQGGGVAESEIWALAPGRDGSVWFATYGNGLGRWKDGAVQQYTKGDGLMSDFVAALCEDPEGGLWIGTDGGVSHLSDGRFTNYTVEDGLYAKAASALACEVDGTVWIGSSGSTAIGGALQVLRAGRLGPVLMSGPEFGGPRSIARARDGALWVGTSTGVYRLKSIEDPLRAERERVGAGPSNKVHIDPHGTVWVGNGLSLYRHLGGALVPNDTAIAGTQKQNVTAFTSDDEGNLWLGHGGLGLVRLRQSQFVTYGPSDGIAGTYVASVLQDRGGTLWLGTANGLTRSRDGQHFLTSVPKGVKSSLTVRALAEDRDGSIWVGTPTDLYHLHPSPCAKSPCVEEAATPLASKAAVINVRVLYVDRGGALWVGTDEQGLLKYEGGALTTYTTKNGLPDDGIRGLAEDADGALWIGTKRGGVARHEHGRFTTLTTKDGLVSDQIQTLYTGQDGTLWIGTRMGVNRRMADGRLVTYTVADGLLARHIAGFLEDTQGNLWMGSGKGPFRVSRAELDDFALGKTKSITSVSYGRPHGLNSTGCSVGHHPTIARTTDGRLWFGTDNGLSVVDPAQLTPNMRPPIVHIEELRVDGRAFDVARPASADPGRGDVVIRYTALNFVAPIRVRFKCRLEPYERNWVDVGTMRVMQYTNVPPGRYRFRVIAANDEGVWNETGADVQLDLAPHFYQTWWFRSLLVLGVAFLGAATQWMRIRNMKKSEQALRVRVDEAVAQIRTLKGLLPICASCKKIRDDGGYWNQMETYIQSHSSADFSHSICPDCMVNLYPDYAAAQKAGLT
jgi:ligand-binding sensor domain-containing protein